MEMRLARKITLLFKMLGGGGELEALEGISKSGRNKWE